MQSNFSPELQFLFNSIRQVILDIPSPSAEGSLDEKELMRKLSFHAIRPIVNDYLESNTSLSRIKATCKSFAQNQAFLSLQQQIEIQRLFELFQSKNIRAIPYKGNLFSRLVYKNKQIREFSDIDILFHPEDAENALISLIKDGYNVAPISGMSKHKEISEIFDATFTYELPMLKEGLHLDFHWGLHYSFLPYKIDPKDIFKELQTDQDFDSSIKIPTREEIFLLMINHHGGKESWLRIKNLVDLIVFLKNLAFDHQKAIELCQNARLLTTLKNGLWIISNFLEVPLPPIFAKIIEHYTPKNIKQTIDFWEKANHWGSLQPRIKFEKILIKQQDEPFSKLSYFRSVYKAYSVPEPYEIKRIVTFPKHWYFLNFLSKIVTYLVRKTFVKRN